MHRNSERIAMNVALAGLFECFKVCNVLNSCWCMAHMQMYNCYNVVQWLCLCHKAKKNHGQRQKFGDWFLSHIIKEVN